MHDVRVTIRQQAGEEHRNGQKKISRASANHYPDHQTTTRTKVGTAVNGSRTVMGLHASTLRAGFHSCWLRLREGQCRTSEGGKEVVYAVSRSDVRID
jgi:hypothetical protein